MDLKFGGILACLLWASLSFVQAQDTPKGRLYLSDLYIQTGLISQNDVSLSLADYRNLAPQSVLLNRDLSEYQGASSFRHYGGRRTTAPLFSMLVGINFREKPNWQLRVGFTQFGESLGNFYLNKTVRTPHDTLVSTQTGSMTFLDSVDSKSYSMQHIRQQMRLEASLIYRTNPEKRWSFYAGIGASLNLQLNGKTQIWYYEHNVLETRATNGNYYVYERSYQNFRHNSNDKSEEFAHKSSLGFTLFAPIGLDFRVGKKHPIWSKVHLFAEIRPSITFSRIDKNYKFSTIGGQHNFGLRFRLGK
jgi:hypothetical protein